MMDMNRDQRCFHCILTDCPGSNGRLGSVTPELFAKLFNPTTNNGAKSKFVGVMAKWKSTVEVIVVVFCPNNSQ